MKNIGDNNSNVQTNSQFIVNLGGKAIKAEVTTEGKIRLENGSTFSVKFNPGGGAVSKDLTTDQQKLLAGAVLKILEDSGGKFDSLDKLTIQSNKITHFDAKGAIKQEVKGEETSHWVKTAQSTMKVVSNWIKGDSNSQSPSVNKEKNTPIKEQRELPHTISLNRVDSNLMNIRQMFDESLNGTHVQENKSKNLNITFEQAFTENKASKSVDDKGKEELESEPQQDVQKNQVSSTKISSPSSEKIPQKVEVTNEQKEKRLEVSKAISSSGAPPKVLAETVVKMLGQEGKIQAFKDQYPEKIGKLQEGWAAAKKEMGAKMDDPQSDPDKKNVSYAQFRDEANKFIHSMVNEAAKQLGISETTTKVFGTPGFNSDKDITFNSADPTKPLTTDEMVLLKSIADMVTTQLMSPKDGMAVLPGTALDTEWYIELKFMGKEVEGLAQKSELATLDMAMALVQAKEGLKNEPEKWKEFMDRDLAQTQGNARTVKLALYEGVERFYVSLEMDIKKELLIQHGYDTGGISKQIHENVHNMKLPELEKRISDIKQKEMEKGGNGFDKMYYNAKVLAQYPKLMQLGEKCGALEREIAVLKGQKPLTQEKQENLDKLIVKHDILYALINSRQPEGTMASSELATTLFSSLGQKAAREKEAATEAQSKILGRSSGGLQGLLAGAKELIKIDEKRDKGSPYDISQLILAGQERLGQFAHVISHDDYAPKSAINAGKYCLRVAESNYHALKEVAAKYDKEGKAWPDELKALLKGTETTEGAETRYFKAKHLEQCKRGFNLNTVSTEGLLKVRLSELGIDIKDKVISSKLNQLELKISDESIAKQEKLSKLCFFLKKEGYLPDTKDLNFGKLSFPMPKDIKLRNILEAYAGLDKKDFTDMKQISDLKKNIEMLTPEKSIDKEGIKGLTDPFRNMINDKKTALKIQEKDIDSALKETGDAQQNKKMKELTQEKEKILEELKFYVGIENALKEIEGSLDEGINLVKNLNIIGGGNVDEKTPIGETNLKSLKVLIKKLSTKFIEETIKDLHKTGEEFVKEAYSLNTNEGVKEFALDVEKFSRDVQNFMFKNELMPQLAHQVPIFSEWDAKK